MCIFKDDKRRTVGIHAKLRCSTSSNSKDVFLNAAAICMSPCLAKNEISILINEAD